MTNEPELDEDGYPTEATLDRIRHWPITESAAALDFIAAAWHWPEFVSHELKPHEAETVHAAVGDRFLRLATGGWSGNEDLIQALDESLVTALTWRLSSCGGLHIYRYPYHG